ncbi:MAG: FAD-dependent oxidoreductase [Methanobrevibacter sp.]|jgi:glycine/D-amino acid oxidase-like deaminating enzyme/nitrite reductase/ring-hydroxylating ferredoxin subunit|nr:FAD-dependent oxidoreductase [Candidatus Methanoflexus mossambicus]
MINAKHMPLWLDIDKKVEFEELTNNIETDVVVIGGGVAGLSIATMLKKEGLNVVVLESNRIGEYITGTTTAKVSYTSSLIYSHILSNFGEDFALKFKEAYFTGFENILQIINDLNIDCDQKRVPFYILSEDESKTDILYNEVEALKKLNIPAKIVENIPFPYEHIHKALVHENQLELNPIKYLYGLANFINDSICNSINNTCNNMSYVFENSKVIAIENNNDFKIIKTEKAIVKCKNVVIATNTPIYDPDSVYKYLNQNKSHGLGIVAKKELSNAMFVVFNPFHTLRSAKTEKGEMLIVLGEHHSIDDSKNRWDFYNNLKEYSANLLDIESIEYYWSGGDNLTEDKIAIIGQTSEKGIYIATGFNSWGINTGMISAKIITDSILNVKNDYADIFSPLRFKDKYPEIDNKKLDRFGDKIAINKTINSTKPIETLINKMDNGEGMLIERTFGTLAIYKKDDENIFILEGKCPHKSCKLHFDNVEKTWECPCHGSVFDYKGKVIRGPAINDLKPIK